MRRCVWLSLVLFVSLALFPSIARAQASITGVVKDGSGGVLPGVTVEAASPALIERVRSVVTDGTGQYRIENLRPGTYSVTFTLPGFATSKREGIELTGTFVATVNADMRVGALEETITVSGETPIVDVQSTTRQQVLSQELISALPSGRNAASMAGMLPAVTIANQDVGGLTGESGSAAGSVTVHGNSEVRTLVSGLSVASAQGSGSTGVGNIAAYQEMAVDISGVSAEQKEGGVRMNLVPKEGGNNYAGSFYAGYANQSMQGDNFSDDLKNRGLSTPNTLKRYVDLNPSYGGPIKRDAVWFYGTFRYNRATNFAPIFYNKNAGNPNVWTYEPDLNREAAVNDGTFKGGNARITWQATQKHKLAVAYDYQNNCQCPRSLTAELSPESNIRNHAFLSPKDMVFVDWTAPVTSRLLLEAGFVKHREHAFRPYRNIYFTNNPGGLKLNAVLEQSNNLTYRAANGDSTDTWNRTVLFRSAASYITGAHAFKVGFNLGFPRQSQQVYNIDSPMSFRFNNGMPNQLTLGATPYLRVSNSVDHGAFVQDRWTTGRMTLTGGLRYDYFHVSFPAATVGPGEFVPNRNLSLAAASGVRWHDLEPRTGAVYDLFGNGKTALKVSLNKYLAYYALPNSGSDAGTFTTNMAPVARLVTSTNRSWGDANRNFVPDCDLLNPLANGECGAMSNPDFGSTRPGVAYDPDTLTGWNKRDYNWQFSVGVQHELLPHVSLDAGYYRTWFGNFVVTDNRALAPGDFDRFAIAAPRDPRLPDGGGYQVTGLFNVKPEKFSVPADNFITYAKKFGDQSRRWDGVDVSVNARPSGTLMLQAGTSTGRTTTDNCEIVDKLPEMLLAPLALGEPNVLGVVALTANTWVPASMCHQQSKFLTNLKFLGVYTVPRADVQVSATIQSYPGPQIIANYVATNAVVAPGLGRNLSGGSANMTVNIVQPGTMYGERSNQVGLRIAKILKVDRFRTTASVDIYNLLNADAVLTESNAFASWQRPQSILNPRWAKVVLQVDF
jgi:Carboxypeptidase regulatory-like domain